MANNAEISNGRDRGGFFSGIDPRVPLLLFFAAFLLYCHTLSFDVVALDDYTLITENKAELSDPGNIGRLFRTDVFLSGRTQYYRPLLNVSLMVDTLARGPYFFVFHLTNILFHSAAASLLYLLLLRLGAASPLSAFLAFFYLFHPSLSQAVAWVPGRNDSMLCVFVLASFLSLLGFLERPSRSSLAGYGLFLLAAVFTKETAVVFPLMSLLYVLSVSGAVLTRRDKLELLGVTAAVLVILALARGAADFPGTHVWLKRSFYNLPALAVMLGKTVFPYDQTVWAELGSVSLLPGLAALALAAFGRRYAAPGSEKLVDFGCLWYLLFMLPTLAAIKGVPSNLHLWEHRQALPMAGFLMAVSALKPARELDFRRFLTAGVSAAVLAYFCACSFVHSCNFSDRITFWKRAAQETRSDPMVYMNLAVFHHAALLFTDAEAYYRKALAADPGVRYAHGNLASMYFARGDLSGAETELLAERKADPSDPTFAENLKAIALMRKGGRVLGTQARHGQIMVRIYTEGKAVPGGPGGSLWR